VDEDIRENSRKEAGAAVGTRPALGFKVET
jgi:hypothetical protein